MAERGQAAVRELNQVLERIKKAEDDIMAAGDSLNDVEEKLKTADAIQAKELKKKRDYLRSKEVLLRQLLSALQQEENRLAEALDRSAAAGLASAAEASYLQRLRDAPAPSLVTPSTEQLASSGPLVRNWRPATVAAGIPPALSHPVFGMFMDRFESSELPSHESVVLASKLCVTTSDYYPDDYFLTEKVRDLLWRFLGEPENARPLLSIRSPTGSYLRTDGALVDSGVHPNYLYMVLEVKEDLDTSEHPSYEGSMVYGKFWASRENSEPFLTSTCPAFLLEVLGPQIRVSAMAMQDRVTVCPLTHMFNLLWLAHGNDHFLELGRLLTALKLGIDTLHHNYDGRQAGGAGGQVGGGQAREPVLVIPAPYPMSQYSAVAPMGNGRLIYNAIRSPGSTGGSTGLGKPISSTPGVSSGRDGKPGSTASAHTPSSSQDEGPSSSTSDFSGSGDSGGVVVRFTRRYGLDVHKAWAALGFAPKVLRTDMLPGRWTMVEMEWLRPEDGWMQLEQLSGADRADAQKAAAAALDAAHKGTSGGGRCMVHGDMRPVNCMVRRASPDEPWEVCFVDFEFAGVEGQTLYPPLMNPAVPWHRDAGFGKPLHRQHDVHLLHASGTRSTSGKTERARLLPVAGVLPTRAAVSLRVVRPTAAGAAAMSRQGVRLVRRC